MYYDLGSDPGEHNNLFPAKLDGGWMFELFLWYRVSRVARDAARLRSSCTGEVGRRFANRPLISTAIVGITTNALVDEDFLRPFAGRGK
jgi:hypothetical protein